MEYCTIDLRQTLDRPWLRVQSISRLSHVKLVLRLRQALLPKLLADHGSMALSELWEALGVSKQRAMGLLQPLLEAGLIEKIGGGRRQVSIR